MVLQVVEVIFIFVCEFRDNIGGIHQLQVDLYVLGDE